MPFGVAAVMIGSGLICAAVWCLVRRDRALGIALLFVGVLALFVPPVRTLQDLRSAWANAAEEDGAVHIEIARAALLASPRYANPLRLSAYEATAFSQAGEDGIIAEIFRRIGTTDRVFVDFGSSDGRENNTALLVRQGWRGLWMDGDAELVSEAKRRYSGSVARGQLTVRREFITAENIAGLIGKAGIGQEFDLLSIDIDRNDYYVWRAISQKPRVVVIEYNAIYPPGVDWVVPYDAGAWWDGTAEYGASLTALERLGASKGYSLVGCNLAGVNAFFVRSDLAKTRFAEPFTAQTHYEPPRFYFGWHKQGHPRR